MHPSHQRSHPRLNFISSTLCALIILAPIPSPRYIKEWPFHTTNNSAKLNFCSETVTTQRLSRLQICGELIGRFHLALPVFPQEDSFKILDLLEEFESLHHPTIAWEQHLKVFFSYRRSKKVKKLVSFLVSWHELGIYALTIHFMSSFSKLFSTVVLALASEMSDCRMMDKHFFLLHMEDRNSLTPQWVSYYFVLWEAFW